MFYTCLSVILFTGEGGCLGPCPGMGDLPRGCPAPGLGVSRPRPGCVCVCIPACIEADTPSPQQMATAADRKHPTEMHSCFSLLNTHCRQSAPSHWGSLVESQTVFNPFFLACSLSVVESKRMRHEFSFLYFLLRWN